MHPDPHTGTVAGTRPWRDTTRWMRTNDPRAYWSIRAVEVASLTSLAALTGAALRGVLHP